MDIFDTCYALMKEQVHKEKKINENSDSFFIELSDLVNSQSNYINLFAGQIIDLFLALYATYSEVYHANKNNKYDIYKKVVPAPMAGNIAVEPLELVQHAIIHNDIINPEEDEDAFFEDEGFEDAGEADFINPEDQALFNEQMINNQPMENNDFDWVHMNV